MTLTLRGVTAGYGDTVVLRDVDLIVPPGRVSALIGANGAGKTTLLRVASSQLRPSAGKVLLDGEDMTGAAPNRLVRRGVCHVPEGRAVFPSLTVRQNLALFEPRRGPGSDRGDNDGAGDVDVTDRALQAFPKLGQRLDQLAGTMSGGEQQMLALARTYVHRPRYVLLDEVSMGLAPKVVEEIFMFLRRLAAEGTALLVVEQYVQQALEMADIVYVLKRGSVAFAGQPSELNADAVAAEYLGTGATDA